MDPHLSFTVFYHQWLLEHLGTSCIEGDTHLVLTGFSVNCELLVLFTSRDLLDFCLQSQQKRGLGNIPFGCKAAFLGAFEDLAWDVELSVIHCCYRKPPRPLANKISHIIPQISQW